MFNLSKRDINVLIGGGAFLIVFIAVQFIYFPTIEKRDTLKRVLAQKYISIDEMTLLAQQYKNISKNINSKKRSMTRREKEFSLFSFLDSQAQKSGVKENVDYMKPFTKKMEASEYTLVTVKVKLKEVYLKELIDFLYHVESSENGITITSLSLNKAGKEIKKLDAVIQAETLMLKGDA